jgi:histidyl-tRNA synthetase
LVLLLPEHIGLQDAKPVVAVVSALEQYPKDSDVGSLLRRDLEVHIANQAIADQIRAAGYRCVQLHPSLSKGKRLGRVLSEASLENTAQVAVLVGENEIASGQYLVRHLGTRQQVGCTRDQIPSTLARLLEEHASTNPSHT